VPDCGGRTCSVAQTERSREPLVPWGRQSLECPSQKRGYQSDRKRMVIVQEYCGGRVTWLRLVPCGTVGNYWRWQNAVGAVDEEEELRVWVDHGARLWEPEVLGTSHMEALEAPQMSKAFGLGPYVGT
jgi:hypothetical protein